jgi:hypothetical protein
VKIPFGSHTAGVVPAVIVPQRFTLPEAVELVAANPAAGLAHLRRLVEEAKQSASPLRAEKGGVDVEELYRRSRSA